MNVVPRHQAKSANANLQAPNQGVWCESSDPNIE